MAYAVQNSDVPYEVTSGGSWFSGAARVLVAWLAVAFAVWVGWMLVATGGTDHDRVRATFILVAMLVASAVFAPVYGGVAYAIAKRRALPATAKGVLWTSVILFVLSGGALVYGMLLISAVGRGLR